jgi:predicted Zn-dependent peptidase
MNDKPRNRTSIRHSMTRFSPLACALLIACGGAQEASPPPVAPPSGAPQAPVAGAASPSTREQPPSSGAQRPSPFPAVAQATLANGVAVDTVEVRSLPIVQIRVVVGAGSGYGRPAVAELTAMMLKEGGTRSLRSAELLERIEALGASLQVDTSFDATTLSMGVLREHLDEALALLGEVVASPRFDEGDFKRLRARQVEEAADRARSSGAFTATRVLFAELYGKESPYGTFGALASEVKAVTSANIRDFHKRYYVPKNTAVIVVGDVDGPTAKARVEKAFGGFRGAEPPQMAFPTASIAAKRRVVIAHRPKSAQSDVFIASLGPERTTSSWPSVRVVMQVLGGGPASRLFMDVREQRSLAYSARASVVELAHGPQPVLASVGTQTPKTALAVEGVLENLERIQTQPLGGDETVGARRYLSDIFAIRMETIGSIADLVAQQRILGLPSGYWDTYRAALAKVEPAEASALAKTLVAPKDALIVVAGDADQIAEPLRRFGEVAVLDPENDFRVLRTLPMAEAGTNAAAPTR